MKERLTQGRELLKVYNQVAIVYLGINAALATLAFDKAPKEALLFEIIGIATAVFFVAVCVGEKRPRKAIERDLARLNDRLGRPLDCATLPYLYYGARASLIWSVLALIGWTVALCKTTRWP
jgi:hypothetical protein